jgi:hypothetical protein
LAAVILGGANAMAASWRGKRKRRVRAHVIADMGINFLERQVLRRGHQLKRVDEPEYGTDALMLHFSPESREIENGWVEFQVKATDNPKFVSNGEYIACQVELAHLHFWYWEIAHPFILVIYDASKHRAFWVEMQSYIELHGMGSGRSLTVRIPKKNKLTMNAVDQFRMMSRGRQQQPS